MAKSLDCWKNHLAYCTDIPYGERNLNLTWFDYDSHTQQSGWFLFGFQNGLEGHQFLQTSKCGTIFIIINETFRNTDDQHHFKDS